MLPTPFDEACIRRFNDTQRMANSLWFAAGKPEGQDKHFWYEAERLLGFDHPSPNGDRIRPTGAK